LLFISKSFAGSPRMCVSVACVSSFHLNIFVQLPSSLFISCIVFSAVHFPTDAGTPIRDNCPAICVWIGREIFLPIIIKFVSCAG
jgi:hypothetical protein